MSVGRTVEGENIHNIKVQIIKNILQEEKTIEKGTITDLFSSNMAEEMSRVFLLMSNFNSRTVF